MVSKQTLNENVNSPFATEGFACLQALRLGIHLGLSFVLIERDARTILIKSQSIFREKSVNWAIIHDIQKLKRNFHHIQFKYISRSANTFAHNLATNCLKSGRESYLVGEALMVANDSSWRSWQRELD